MDKEKARIAIQELAGDSPAKAEALEVEHLQYRRAGSNIYK